MSAIRIDGLDVYGEVGATLTQASLAGTGFSLFENGPGSAITAQAGVTPASRAFRFSRDPSFYSNMAFDFTSDVNELVVGLAFKASTRGAIFNLNDAITVGWSTGGPLTLNERVGDTTVVLGRWYYLELVLNRDTQFASLYLNNELYLEIAWPTAIQTATSWSITCGWQASGNAGTLLIDDLVIVDSEDNGDGILGRIGPVENLPFFPASVTADEFDNPTNRTPVEVVSDVPPSASQYLESSVSGARELFTRSDFADDRDIVAMSVIGVLSKTDLDGRKMGLQLETAAGIQEEEFDVDLTFSYKQVTYAWDAAREPWTVAKINAAQWGAVVRP